MHQSGTIRAGSVAIIGAGPCGLSAAKYIEAECAFSRIELFEQRHTVGGTWVYSPWLATEGSPDRDPYDDDDITRLISPIYDTLDTNIPKTLMQYADLPFPDDVGLFPSRQAVKTYLDHYAVSVRSPIHYHMEVYTVEKVELDNRQVWAVKTRNLETDQRDVWYFDAVLVASGHYSSCYFPRTPGLKAFREAYPAAISHAKLYRTPDRFAGKKVVIVGNSASGIDISAQVSTKSQLPVLVSVKKMPEDGTSATDSTIRLVPEIQEFEVSQKTIRFTDGTVETNVDHVIFCTGYLYKYAFLESLSPAVTDAEGSHSVNHLYQHLFYINDPTLAFVGIPMRIVPFPVSEAQAAWVAGVWSGRLELPAESEMRSWMAQSQLDSMARGKNPHDMAYPADVDYVNMLYKLSLSAQSTSATETGTNGKTPPFWDDEKRWLRREMPRVKAAARSLGLEERAKIRSLDQLGFTYDKTKSQVLENASL